MTVFQLLPIVLARGFVVLLFVGGMTACTISDSCELYNNSGSELVIVRSQRGAEEPPIHVGPGESTLLSGWIFWEYRVTMGGIVSRYSPKAPGTGFAISSGFGPWTKRIFRAQIDSRGQIFLLKPDQSVPATEFVVQPNGFPLVASDTADKQSQALVEFVASPGPDTRTDHLKQLRGSGRDAVRLLIATLRPIPEDKVLLEKNNTHRAALHAVWALRALRYLTGKDFRARTAHAFGPGEDERRREQLLKKEDGTVTFFAIWMSRDSVYIAPADAQRAIIEAWQRWFSEQDENWRPISEPGVDDWYF